MSATCVVDFENNPSKIVYTDQYLRGTVIMALTKTKTVRGVFMKITGKGQTHWTRSVGKQHKSYGGEEQYLDGKIYLAGCVGNLGKKNCIYSNF